MSHSSNAIFDSAPGIAKPHNGELTYTAPEVAPTIGDPGDLRAEEVAVISHEIRNSLAVIRGASRLLRAPASIGAKEDALSLIDRHLGHMSRHISDLTEPLRRGGHDSQLHLTHVDLRAMARHAVEAISPEIARRRHRLTVELPEEPAWVRGDGARLEQVFSNLLINAAKYTDDGGDIALIMDRDQERIRVRIRDSGVGIEAAMLPRVFGMFVQVDATLCRAEGGRGIGLAVVRKLVEMHGGTVRAASAGPGFGSEFTVVLPALWAGTDSGTTSP